MPPALRVPMSRPSAALTGSSSSGRQRDWRPATQVSAARCWCSMKFRRFRRWSETVKRLWDEDTHTRSCIKVVVLGSAPLLISRGLTEILQGALSYCICRIGLTRKCTSAFGWNVEQYLYFGGYPGCAPLIRDGVRWKRYVLDSLIETTISRDVLLLSRVDKPAMLRRLFKVGCRYSGQILSYTKMLGQIQDAGNSTTLAHYLDLLAGAGMVCGLQKFAGEPVRQRGSSPKLQVFNTALMTAQSGYTLKEAASTMNTGAASLSLQWALTRRMQRQQGSAKCSIGATGGGSGFHRTLRQFGTGDRSKEWADPQRPLWAYGFWRSVQTPSKTVGRR